MVTYSFQLLGYFLANRRKRARIEGAFRFVIHRGEGFKIDPDGIYHTSQ